MDQTAKNRANARPRVSVVVPVYNEEAYLAQCLDSLLGQTLADIEVICVDDGSTDATPAILAEHAARDERLRVITQPNAGPAKARNRAADLAQGDYLYFFDSDDFCEPGLLAGAVAVADRLEADLVALPFKLYDNELKTAISVPWSLPRHLFPEGAFTWRDNPDAAFSTFRTVPWNKLVRTSFVRENGIRFQDDVFLSEDVMFSLPAVVLARRIACTDEALVYHRENLGTSAMDTKDSHPEDFLHAFKALRSFLEGQGVMGELRAAYVNWVVGGCIYNLLTLKGLDTYDAAFSHLQNGGLEELGVSTEDAGLLANHVDADALRAIASGRAEGLLFAEQGRLRAEYDRSCYRERVQIEKCEGLQAQLDDAHARLEALEARQRELETQLDDARDEHARAMNAAEQKVGRAICYVPRLIQRKLIKLTGRRG